MTGPERDLPVDPEGPDPDGVPDPMPDDLASTPEADEAFADADPMEGEAPTG